MAGAAVLVSAGLHAGGLIAVAPPAPPASLGGAAQLAMLGNSFQDAVAGTIAATPTTDMAETVTPTAGPQPVTTPAIAPTPPATAQPVSPVTPAQPVTAAALPGAQAVVPVTVTPPDRAASAPVETVTALAPPPVQTPTADTPRPRARPAPQAEAAPAGNAERTTRRGDAEGQPQGRAAATARGDQGQSASDGRVAAEYPEIVNRQIARLRRPATRFSGAAVIAFTIGGNGGLSALSVARSSGNADFDRLALAHVQSTEQALPTPSGALK